MIILLWPPGWLILAGLALCLVLACAETGGSRRVEPPPRQVNHAAFTLGRVLACAGIYLAGLCIVGFALHLAGF
jgi:hypothetical protein